MGVLGSTNHTSNTTAICDVAPPANTARGRGNVWLNTVRSCFATICSVTECAVLNAMGNKVIVSYLPGNALRTVIDMRSEGALRRLIPLCTRGVRTRGYHGPFGQKEMTFLVTVRARCRRRCRRSRPLRRLRCGLAGRVRLEPRARMGSGIDCTAGSLSHGVAVRFPPVVVAAGWHCGTREYEHDEAARAG